MMTMDEAVRLVMDKSGLYPVQAFEFENTFYVMMTPLSDYRPGEDVAHCYYPVTYGRVGDPLSVFEMLIGSSDPEAITAAAKHSVNYLNRDIK